MARGRRTETGRLNITVRGGVDVSQQIYGDSKGSYFQGSIPDQDITVRVQGGVKHYWHLCLDNVATGRQYPFVFAYELLIGRTPLTNGGENKLVLSADVSVSGSVTTGSEKNTPSPRPSPPFFFIFSGPSPS